MSEDHSTAVVIDNGSSTCRAGFSGEDDPCCVIPSVVGRPRGYSGAQSTDIENVCVGHEAVAKRGTHTAKYPVEYGLITNWDDMELLWQHIFEKELKVDPMSRPVFLTETPLNPKCNREKTALVMFETFQVPTMYVGIRPVLSLYSSGRTTGVVVQMGDGVGLSVPVYEGYCLPHAIMKINIAGRDITDLLMRQLIESGYSFTTVAEREIVRDIKEKHCSVALDLDLQLMTTPTSYEQKYILPDGKSITIGKERFIAPEAIFDPSFIGYEMAQGIHYCTYYSIKKCDKDISKDLYCNIALLGGSTRFPGFPERFKKELNSLAPKDTDINVSPPFKSEHSAWIGGSIVSSLPSFQDMWISNEEYEEYGPGIIHRKCF